MKNYLSKTIAGLLLFIVFPMTSDLCLQSFFGSSFMVPAAQAASFDRSAAPASLDACAASADNQTSAAAPDIDRQDSLLPCCTNGSHYSTATISPTLDLDNIGITLFYPEPFLLVPLKLVVYDNPLTAPPELPALRSTVLRL